jgi:predicted transcriptional regulator
MPSRNLVCPHCGKADWSKSPRARAVLLYTRKRGDATSREVSDQFGVSIANASNILNSLAGLGLLRRGESRPNPNGGVFYVYHPTEAEL